MTAPSDAARKAAKEFWRNWVDVPVQTDEEEELYVAAILDNFAAARVREAYEAAAQICDDYAEWATRYSFPTAVQSGKSCAENIRSLAARSKP